MMWNVITVDMMRLILDRYYEHEIDIEKMDDVKIAAIYYDLLNIGAIKQ